MAGVGHGCVAEGNVQVSVADEVVVVGGAAVGLGVADGVGEVDVAGQGAADGGGAQWGQGGVSADAVPGAGLGLVPAEGVLAGREGFFDRPAACGDGDETGSWWRAAPAVPSTGEKVYWSGRVISRRMSRYWPSMRVAVLAQSL